MRRIMVESEGQYKVVADVYDEIYGNLKGQVFDGRVVKDRNRETVYLTLAPGEEEFQIDPASVEKIR